MKYSFRQPQHVQSRIQPSHTSASGHAVLVSGHGGQMRPQMMRLPNQATPQQPTTQGVRQPQVLQPRPPRIVKTEGYFFNRRSNC